VSGISLWAVLLASIVEMDLNPFSIFSTKQGFRLPSASESAATLFSFKFASRCDELDRAWTNSPNNLSTRPDDMELGRRLPPDPVRSSKGKTTDSSMGGVLAKLSITSGAGNLSTLCAAPGLASMNSEHALWKSRE